MAIQIVNSPTLLQWLEQNKRHESLQAAGLCDNLPKNKLGNDIAVPGGQADMPQPFAKSAFTMTRVSTAARFGAGFRYEVLELVAPALLTPAAATT